MTEILRYDVIIVGSGASNNTFNRTLCRRRKTTPSSANR